MEARRRQVVQLQRQLRATVGQAFEADATGLLELERMHVAVVAGLEGRLLAQRAAFWQAARTAQW